MTASFVCLPTASFFGATFKCPALYCLCLTIAVVAIISPAAGLCAKSIISPGRTDTEIYFQSGRGHG